MARLVARSTDHVPQGPYYWGRVPLERGHAFTLIGWEPLPSGRGTEFWIAALLGASTAAELVIYADPRTRHVRYASMVGPRSEACLFIARSGVRTAGARRRSGGAWHAHRAGMRVLSLAGGQPGRRGGAERVGPTICACFGVGLHTLHGAIASRRLTSVAEIGAVLRAGTNCGSCIPELNAILNSAQAQTTTAA